MAGPSWLAWTFASVMIVSGRLLPDPAGGLLAAASPEPITAWTASTC